MKFKHLFVLMSFALSGCGILPGGGRFYSDVHNASHYAIAGANRTKVRLDFGKPDEIISHEIIETWVYYKRQAGKTYKFDFNPQGMLISTEIVDPEE